ncbi:MAG TPA: hypothetical protein VFV61_08140, partial [Pyrinomonadaceae bacterium]|nr:hypothetical protein [Pyrinomonadaceae bacterium]
ATGNNQRVYLKIAESLAGRIAKERMPWADPLASLVRAGVAYKRGETAAATTTLADAAEHFDLAEMQLYAAAARRRLGKLIGGRRGEELLTEADAWMREQKIDNPERMTRMLAPGFD